MPGCGSSARPHPAPLPGPVVHSGHPVGTLHVSHATAVRRSWSHEAVLSSALAAQEDYRKAALRDAPPLTELPTRSPRMAHHVTEAFGRRLPVAEVMPRPATESLGARLRVDDVHRAPGSLIEFRRGTGPRVVRVHPAAAPPSVTCPWLPSCRNRPACTASSHRA
jgi:hypothetical protein